MNWSLSCLAHSPYHYLLAPHTNGPKDAPRCGGSEFTKKIAPYRGGIQQNLLLGSNGIFATAWWLVVVSPPLDPLRIFVETTTQALKKWTAAAPGSQREATARRKRTAARLLRYRARAWVNARCGRG
jgi:hypothetical protein